MGIKRATQRAMDRYAGYVLTSTLGLFTTKKKPPKRPKRILVIKLWAVGESILTLPLIAALRRHFPNAKIDVLASRRNASVYEHQQAVRKVIMPTEVIRKPTYDLVFDCEPYFNLSALMGWLAGTFSIGFAHGSRAKVYSAKVPYNPRRQRVDGEEGCRTSSVLGVEGVDNLELCGSKHL